MTNRVQCWPSLTLHAAPENLDILEVLGSSDEVLPLVAARMAAAEGVPLARPLPAAECLAAAPAGAPGAGAPCKSLNPGPGSGSAVPLQGPASETPAPVAGRACEEGAAAAACAGPRGQPVQGLSGLGFGVGGPEDRSGLPSSAPARGFGDGDARQVRGPESRPAAVANTAPAPVAGAPRSAPGPAACLAAGAAAVVAVAVATLPTPAAGGVPSGATLSSLGTARAATVVTLSKPGLRDGAPALLPLVTAVAAPAAAAGQQAAGEAIGDGRPAAACAPAGPAGRCGGDGAVAASANPSPSGAGPPSGATGAGNAPEACQPAASEPARQAVVCGGGCDPGPDQGECGGAGIAPPGALSGTLSLSVSGIELDVLPSG